MPKWQFVADKEMRRTPKGHFVVYVADELKRFIVPLSYLKNPIFQKLLEKAAEEYGFNSHRSIVLPCDEIDFQRVADYLEAKKS